MENDKFYFYSRSKNNLPGKGANELVSDISLYGELSKYPYFRKVLSNFHVYPFMFEGYTYKSIEHVFQAKKIALVDPEKALYFTMESEHEIGQGDGALAQKHRKLVKLDAKTLKKWDLIKDCVMKQAALAKYSACEEARVILKATRKAQLWHIVPRKPAVRFQHLEEIRAIIS